MTDFLTDDNTPAPGSDAETADATIESICARSEVNSWCSAE